MQSSIDEVVANIIDESTCGFAQCVDEPAWKIDTIRIWTTDGGEVELSYEDVPLNRVCNFHKKRKKTHIMIANKAWAKVLRSLLIENPQYSGEIQEGIRLRRFVIQWKQI